MKKNTANEYFTTLKTILRKAMREGILLSNPMDKIDSIGKEKALPKYLTFDEIKKLNQAFCPNDEVKRAFLFSCFTGIRFSDISDLTWEQIIKTKNRIYINFK